MVTITKIHIGGFEVSCAKSNTWEDGRTLHVMCCPYYSWNASCLINCYVFR